MKSIRNLFAKRRAAPVTVDPGPRLELTEMPAAVYVVGDIHGCYHLLTEIEQRIAEDGQDISGDKLIVHVGDAIDRGGQSAEVIDHLIATPPAGFERLCLLGNHELLMREFLAEPRRSANWLSFGGLETLMSYGLNEHQIRSTRDLRMLLDAVIPEEHRSFLADLALCLDLPEYFITHAGVDPDTPLTQQSAQDLLWMREPFLSWDGPLEKVVIHGHTPCKKVEVKDNRIRVDTGAYASGRLSAVRIRTGEPAVTIEARHG